MNRNDINSYYEFNDKQKEIIFKRYDMPSPWLNYLSNGTFHTMMSQAGGGLSFYKSPQIWRINRYRFFHLPTDRSGHYIYIKDGDEYWSPTNEPCKTKPEKWQSKHGIGYTNFNAERNGVLADLTYFVGEFKNSLIWNCKLKNTTDKVKTLSVFAYVEFGMMEFMRELQWYCYNKHQLSVQYLKEGIIVYKYGVETQSKPDETPLVYLSSNIMPIAYDGDRDEFVGTYRSEENPYCVEVGKCSNSTMLGGDPCGALQFEITLQPNEEKELNIFLGTEMTEEEIVQSAEYQRQGDFVEKSFLALKKNWTGRLDKFKVDMENKDIERMVNIWNPYQAQRNFQFSRNISYYATGTFRGVGYRDTMQDILSEIPFNLETSKEKIKLLLTQQYNDGHVNHYFFPNEGWEPVKSIHSDDHLWSIMAVYALIMESGSLDILDEKVEYFDGNAGTIYEHLWKALEFSSTQLGANGFPLMLRSDWNDSLFKVCKEGKGESIWTSMQLGVVLKQFAEIARLRNDEDKAVWCDKFYAKQKELVNTIGWDGKWFRRAIMDNGEFLGTHTQDEAKIFLNTQTWAVISGMGDIDKCITAMDSVKELLDTPLGIKKLYPPIVNFPTPEDPLTHYNPGTGENGSVFCHANTWAIIAECMLGRADNAYKYYTQLMPKNTMETAGVWRYKAEPYAYASNLFGPESDKFGLANVSWLTGTAAWMYIAVTQYMLGIRPTWDGIEVKPCLPKNMGEIKVNREFRGEMLTLEI